MTSSAARAVVTAVLGLGAGLERVVVVEGVEDGATPVALRALGAHHGPATSALITAGVLAHPGG